MKFPDNIKEHGLGISLSFALPLLVYALTLCRVIAPFQLGDSGELGTAVYVMGIPHPPGYPFYTILGKFFGAFFRPEKPILTYNLLSAIFSALTVSLIYLIGTQFTKYKTLAVGAALTCAFLPVFWAQATIAEVYSVYTFFLVLLIYLIINPPTSNYKHLAYLIAFVFGVSLSHHLIMVILLPSLLLFALFKRKDFNFTPKSILIILFLGTLGFSLYSILSIRAYAEPPSHWPRPVTFKQLTDHVTSRTYKDMFFSSTTSQEALVKRFTFIASFLAKQINPLFYLGGVVGLFLLFKEEKLCFTFVFLLIVFDLLYSQFINVGDILAVGLASLICFTFAFIKAADYFVEQLTKKLRFALVFVCIGLYLLPLSLLAANYQKMDLSKVKNDFKIKEYTKAFYLLDKGKKLDKQGNKMKAFLAFDEASLVGHYLEWLQREIAAYNMKNKRYYEAQKCYQAAIEINPTDAYLYAQLAYAFEMERNLEQAVVNYLKAMELAPQAIDSYINLGLVYDKLQEYEKQLQLLEKAIILAPENPDVVYHYAESLKRNKRFEEAISNYRKVIRLNVDYLPAYFDLALLLEIPAPAEAVDYWVRYLRRAKGSPVEQLYINTAIVRLENLRRKK